MAETNLEKYKSNSYRARAEEEKEVQKVVKGNAKLHKKTKAEKLKDTLFGEGVDNVGDYLIFDVMVPAIKELVVNSVSDGINMLMFGDTKSSMRSSRDRDRGSYVSYDSYSNRRKVRDKEMARRARFDFSDIEFDDPSDIDDVINELIDAWDVYRCVSVAQFYTSCGIKPSPNDHKWGWINIRELTDARISTIKVRNDETGKIETKWIINLPKPKPID